MGNGAKMMFIPITNGMWATIDDDDFALISKWKWQANEKLGGFRYACSSAGSMHRIIMGAKDGQEIDHINGDKLDNRRSNLRFCSRSNNCCNKKIPEGKFRGVIKAGNRWRAYYKINGKQVHVGQFATREEAALARDAAAKVAHGEFAVLNFPEAGRG